MGLQEAYNAEVEAIRSGQLSHPDESKCGCRGGWFLTDFDTWEECPCHRGRRHPEDEPELDPWLCIDIEQADGSPYDGVITYEYDGDKVYNDHGSVYRFPEKSPADLERARARAREWRDHLNKLFPERNLKVRLHREWI